MIKNTSQSSTKGKAYEYACVLAVCEALQGIRSFEIIQNRSLDIARKRYAEITETEQRDMLLSAKAGMAVIFDFEPNITENTVDMLEIALQPDNVAIKGDIRDILILRQAQQWEIGISVKHNHAALKHSRLSKTLDFGKTWLRKPCSVMYFQNIEPIFSFLEQEKSKGILWRDLNNKAERVYLPVLRAFKQEFETLSGIYPKHVTKNIVKYLLGSQGKDYYKLIHYNNHNVRVQPFNIFGTLNQKAGNIAPAQIFGTMTLPTKIVDLSFRTNSNTTLNLTMDNGWAISFRLHSASSYVEPSLKFDIQLIGQPANMFYCDAAWE